MENKSNMGDLFKNGKTTKAKPHQMNLRSLLLKIHYYQNMQLQERNLSTLYQPIVEPLPKYLIGLVL